MASVLCCCGRVKFSVRVPSIFYFLFLFFFLSLSSKMLALVWFKLHFVQNFPFIVYSTFKERKLSYFWDLNKNALEMSIEKIDSWGATNSTQSQQGPIFSPSHTNFSSKSTIFGICALIRISLPCDRVLPFPTGVDMGSKGVAAAQPALSLPTSVVCCMCGDLGLSQELFRCEFCLVRSQHKWDMLFLNSFWSSSGKISLSILFLSSSGTAAICIQELNRTGHATGVWSRKQHVSVQWKVQQRQPPRTITLLLCIVIPLPTMTAVAL